jgi:4-carboxymuconolactone decarboxylase
LIGRIIEVGQERLPDLDEKALTPQQRRVYEAILSGPRGVVEGPLRVWLRSPELADKAQALGSFCRYGTSLPPRLSELAIITVGAWWRAGFEWAVHAPIASEAGLSKADVETIRTGGEPRFEKKDEAAVHAFTHELVRERSVSDATYDLAIEALGVDAVVELVGIIGYYAFISMTINVFNVPLPAGAKDPFTPK